MPPARGRRLPLACRADRAYRPARSWRCPAQRGWRGTSRSLTVSCG